MIDTFNAKCVSFVPKQGSVGASGDLAPLAHLACGMLGVGKMWHRCVLHLHSFCSHLTILRASSEWRPAAEVLAEAGLQPLRLSAKEGLSMINGTQVSFCYVCLA